VEIKYNFHKGAYVEYLGDINDPNINLEFIDTNTNNIIYKTNLFPNHWSKTEYQHYINWRIKITINDQIKLDHIMDLENKRVVIIFSYETLGDFIMWMPIFESFRKKHKCILIVQCKQIGYIKVVKNSYPNIIFVKDYKDLFEETIYAVYEPRLDYYEKYFWNGQWPKTHAEQNFIIKLLGMDSTLLPIVDSDNEPVSIDEKYVCIIEHAQTNFKKVWNRPLGFETVTEWLVNKGYKVVPISKEPTRLKDIKGVIDKTGCSLSEMIRLMKNSELVIGLDTGSTWAGSTLKVPIIMIMTTTSPYPQFPQINYVYNHTEGTCYGCWKTSVKGEFGSRLCDKIQENGLSECVMNITPEMVIDKIKEVLKIEE
jgi:autotransporter strand-loop-strand O-heptosyltransferase